MVTWKRAFFDWVTEIDDIEVENGCDGFSFEVELTMT